MEQPIRQQGDIPAMATNTMTLKEMIEAAKIPDQEDLVMRLLERIKNADTNVQELRDEASSFDEMFELWNEDITKSEDKAELCVRLAELSVLDTPNFRSALHLAVRKLLPPYLASGSVVKAVGAKDAAVSVHDAALRLRKLQHLRSTALVYQQDNHQWGKINSIDKVIGTLAVSGFNSSSVSSIPIASAIVSCHFFNTTPEFLNLLYPARTALIPAVQYKKLFQLNALADISEQKIRDIVFHLTVPSAMSQDAFETWWNADAGKPALAASERTYINARSILELHTLIRKAHENGQAQLPPLNGESAEKLSKLFSHIRSISAKDVTMLMECIADIVSAPSDPELLRQVFSPLRGKVPFWPASVSERMDMRTFESWGHLSVKLLPAFADLTTRLYTPQEMIAICTLLPLRCLTVCMEKLDKDAVTEALLKLKNLSSDLILWIWKNRSRLNSRLVECIDMGRVATALSQENLPREWTAAQRELKKLLFDKSDFQKFLIDNASGDIPSIISAIKRCRSFQSGERQSVMVKLGRHSEELKAYIEGGEGRKMMGDAAQTPEQAPVTSVKSLKRLTDEYEKLVKVDIPENSAAVALARSYGDLRENAEYDAAKERRTFLNRRRVELERTLSFIESTDFKDVRIEDQVIPGCLVNLEGANGEKRRFFVLGAWDGDPEKNYIAYTTKTGQALLHKKIGDQVELPGGGSFTIREILPLPEDVLKDLAGEA